LLIAMAAVLLSAANIITFLLVRGPERVVQQGVRFALTVILSVHLCRGAPWARWVAIVLYGFAGGFGVLALLRLQQFDTRAVLVAALPAIYLGSCIALVALPSVRVHFGGWATRSANARRRRVPRPLDAQLSQASHDGQARRRADDRH